MLQTPKKIAKRDAQKTRSKILSCASDCFARSGYEGTSLKNILEKAAINKRMVYHYYGSKENLYRAVHLKQWKMLSHWLTQRLSKTKLEEKVWDAKTLIIKSTEIFHDFCESHQDFLRLLLWDGLEGGKVSRSIWEDIRGPLYQQVASLFQGSPSQTCLHLDALSADHLIVSFMGAILFYFAYSNSLTDIFGGDPLDPQSVQKRKAQVLEQLSQLLK